MPKFSTDLFVFLTQPLVQQNIFLVLLRNFVYLLQIELLLGAHHLKLAVSSGLNLRTNGLRKFRTHSPHSLLGFRRVRQSCSETNMRDLLLKLFHLVITDPLHMKNKKTVSLTVISFLPSPITAS